MVVQKGTVGVWNGTAVRLFKVETVAASGPSLMKVRASRHAFVSNLYLSVGLFWNHVPFCSMIYIRNRALPFIHMLT